MVKVVYFASLRERLGVAEESIEVSQPADVAAVLNQLVELHGEQWQKILVDTPILMAVNQEMCDEKAAVAAGDEVAFFPPVTGG
ncbi:molybdopterin converting factor subunit 1 [Neptuniibacter sp. QD37_6]|uniref:molybdopterin converting factor subunit 1 n=1 Tax=Neptuniibacter sp. QD37_6 TaxID=3398210 RepID=UPI0039F47E5D